MTVRIPLGAKTRSGPFHANMIESWLTNDPGLIIVTPSNPQDAYDLLIESHHLPDPVVYLEHIGLYGLRGGITVWGKSINQIVDTGAVMNRLEKFCNLDIRQNIEYKKSYCINDFVQDYNAYKGNAYGLANTLMQTANLKPKIKNKKVDNLFYTGQLTVPGPGVPPSIISGQLVAEQIIKSI